MLMMAAARLAGWSTVLRACAAVLIALVAGACGDGSSDDGAPRVAPTAFRDAVEAGDIDALVATLADDIRLYSPVLEEPFEGGERVSRLFRVLATIFEDIRITEECQPEPERYVLSFHARVGTVDVQVVDLLHFDADGRIDEFVVTMRPLRGIQALAAAVAPHLSDIKG